MKNVNGFKNRFSFNEFVLLARQLGVKDVIYLNDLAMESTEEKRKKYIYKRVFRVVVYIWASFRIDVKVGA